MQKSPDLTLLEVVTEQLIEHATKVLIGRFNFLDMLRSWAIPIHFKISSELENLKIEYESSLKLSEEATKDEIKEHIIHQFKKTIKQDNYRDKISIHLHLYEYN